MSIANHPEVSMPTPARTSLDEIVTVGRRLIEPAGLNGLTMQAVAAEVGIRAPSLYKHVANRDQLVKLIVDDAIDELAASLERVVDGQDPGADLAALARAFRSFARMYPGAYGLIFSSMPEKARPDPDRLAQASEAVMRATASLAGPGHALEAARTLTAWAHGFVSMELAGAFRLGGEIDRAFEFGVQCLGAALARK
jgi:AcrR family transcriptional regulator